jgi:hypothetical protein
LARKREFARWRRSENTARAARSASRAELTAFETVEQALGGEEAEAAYVSGHDSNGAVVDLDDVGVGLGLGHDCSFAGVAAFLSWKLRCEMLLGPVSNNNRRPLPPRNSAASCTRARRLDYAGDRFSSCGFGSRSSFDASNIEPTAQLVNEMAIHICGRRALAFLPPQVPANGFISR